MKLSRQALAASVLSMAAAAAFAAPASAPTARNRVARATPRSAAAAAPKAAAVAGSYSVEVPYVRSYAPPNGGQSGTLVLNQAHSFSVTLLATDQHHGNVTGAGVALPQTDTFGYFSLPTITDNPSNPEVFVKILDGRPINGAYWVFYGHLTDLIYDLTVTDNVTQASKTYHKNAGNEPGGFDTGGFPASASTATNTKVSAITPDAYVRTAIDISNNTNSDGVNAVIQYCYSTGGAFQGCTDQRTVTLDHLANFHQDDIVDYLVSVGDISAASAQDSSGTFLVTFDNLPSNEGWEGTVTASTYSRVSEVDPLRGTIGCGQVASLFFESATGSIVGTARDTVPAPTADAGSLATILGIHNTYANGANQTSVTVDITLYDPSNGQPVGNVITLANIQPGELRLVDDLFGTAAVPTNVSSVIVFADTRSAGVGPTIEGFILDHDTESGDTRFHDMKCASGCF